MYTVVVCGVCVCVGGGGGAGRGGYLRVSCYMLFKYIIKIYLYTGVSLISFYQCKCV